MAQQNDELEKWATDVIFGRVRGFLPSIIRLLLSAFSLLFRGLVKARLWLIRHGWKPSQELGTFVLSIGNLTMGGTGKTPIVELFSRELIKKNRKIAILSRGYKSKPLSTPQTWTHPTSGKQSKSPPKIVSDGTATHLTVDHAGDEPYMLAKNLPGVSVIVDRDRARGGKFAVTQLACDTLILDDGMQNFHLGHSMDIVLLDQSTPFGTNGMIPRGTLREPPSHLKRAHYIFITKCDGTPNHALIQKIKKYNSTAGIIECTHAPQHLRDVFSQKTYPLQKLHNLYIAAISGIAMPESFETLLKQLGAKVEFHKTFSDHHSFSQTEIDDFMKRCLRRGIQMIITTEKDAVRFLPPTEPDLPIFYLRIEIEILNGHETFQQCLEKITHRPEKPAEDWTDKRLLTHT